MTYAIKHVFQEHPWSPEIHLPAVEGCSYSYTQEWWKYHSWWYWNAHPPNIHWGGVRGKEGRWIRVTRVTFCLLFLATPGATQLYLQWRSVVLGRTELMSLFLFCLHPKNSSWKMRIKKANCFVWFKMKEKVFSGWYIRLRFWKDLNNYEEHYKNFSIVAGCSDWKQGEVSGK